MLKLSPEEDLFLDFLLNDSQFSFVFQPIKSVFASLWAAVVIV